MYFLTALEAGRLEARDTAPRSRCRLRGPCFLASPGSPSTAVSPWHSLPCRCISPISASAFLWPSFPCICLSSRDLPIRTLVIGFRAHPHPVLTSSYGMAQTKTLFPIRSPSEVPRGCEFGGTPFNPVQPPSPWPGRGQGAAGPWEARCRPRSPAASGVGTAETHSEAAVTQAPSCHLRVGMGLAFSRAFIQQSLPEQLPGAQLWGCRRP